MGPEHYVRPENDNEPEAPVTSVWRRLGRRFTNFMINKQPDHNPPGIHPYNGFNSNGREHSSGH